MGKVKVFDRTAVFRAKGIPQKATIFQCEKCGCSDVDNEMVAVFGEVRRVLEGELDNKLIMGHSLKVDGTVKEVQILCEACFGDLWRER